MFGATLAKLFSAQEHRCLPGGTRQQPEFAVTRISAGPTTLTKAPACPQDDAFLVWVSLTPPSIEQWRARYDGRDVGVTRPIAFATTVLDLNRSIQMWNRGPFDYLHFYIAGPLLKRVAAENGVSTAYRLRDTFFVEDIVVAQLTRSILLPVARGERFDTLALDEIALLLGAHVLQRYGGLSEVPMLARRGLQEWQKLRAEELLRARLDGNITMKELATACSLSVSHFARVFRRSFSMSARQYLIRLRLERAKNLLASTKMPLAEVAALCGFCDQPAFTRAFIKVERLSPSHWRKANN